MNDFNRLHGLYHSGLAKEELQRRKNCYMVLNRDFLEDLPYQVREVLDRLKYDYGNRSWFPEAWEKYRKHVLEAGLGGKIKMPGAVFNEYLDKYELKLLEKVYSNVGGESSVPMYHSAIPVKLTFDMYVDDYMQHYGVKGQKWGVRRFQNEDGTLTSEGKKRYEVDESGNMSEQGKKLYEQENRKLKVQLAERDVKEAGLNPSMLANVQENVRRGNEAAKLITEKYGNKTMADYAKKMGLKSAGKGLAIALLGTIASVAPMVALAIKSRNDTILPTSSTVKESAGSKVVSDMMLSIARDYLHK